MAENKNYRYVLCNARPMKMFICPRCGKREFKRYVDTETGEYLDSHLGRCNRQQKCGYHAKPEYKPREGDRTQMPKVVPKVQQVQQVQAMPTFIPPQVMQRSLQGQNNLAQWLATLKGDEAAQQALNKYHVGSSKHWPGATVFWQVDGQGNVRTGKVMLYNKDTGKRVREPFSHITWAHKLLVDSGQLPGFNLQQCMFGSHLLSRTETLYNMVCIVESEKTALVASMYHSRFIWLACGSLNGLTAENLRALAGRNVLLCPDKGCMQQWKDKVEELNVPNVLLRVTNFMEKTNLPQGSDMADYLVALPANLPPVTTNSEPLQKLIAKNPAIVKLVSRFGLVEDE
jgi:hypothetical protein